jgi:hypothetical protein
LAAGDEKYKLASVRKDVYHVKRGSVFMNFLLGCCAEYYEYEINLMNEKTVTVNCTSVCNGRLGGYAGVTKTKKETERVKSLLSQAFPGRQVV